MIDWAKVFGEAQPYGAFLDRYATAEQRARWDAMHRRIELTSAQKNTLAGFTREMPVLVLNGAWCGDCINQCPIFDHFARVAKTIDLRFFDRDARDDVRSELGINGGHRVPVVVWLSEDFQEVSRFGDRTLSRYRELGAQAIGPSCPTGIVPPAQEPLAAVVQEWLDLFERVHWILRLSPRLRTKHSD